MPTQPLHLSVQITATFIPIASYPPCVSGQDNQSLLPTQVNLPTKLHTTKLGNGLTLEEYSSAYVAGQGWPHAQDSGCSYVTRNRATDNYISLDNSFQILLSPIDDQTELVTVKQDKLTIFETKAYTYIYSGLMEAWSYDNHWVIETLTSEAQGVDVSHKDTQSLMDIQEKLRDYLDIIRDGVSLKEANGYQQVFSFQILNGKPFYFYKRGEKYGINYDGVEAQLDYDYVTWNRPHPGVESFVWQFQNMVLFYGSRGGKGFMVIIGAFDR